MAVIKLVTKLVLFAFILVWVLGLIFTAVVLFPGFLDTVKSYGIPAGVTSWFLQGWYWITVVLVSTFIAYRGFGVIGKWEKE